MEITPTEYDVIVIGTGITECILAAACSRVGKTVLHLDINKFYGEQWSSFTLKCLEKCAEEEYVSPGSLKYQHFLQNLNFENTIKENTITANTIKEDLLVEKIHANDPVKESVEEISSEKIWTKDEFEAKKRRVNIDITPKLCYCDGAMVNLLKSSNCSRYLEFKALNRCFVHHNGELIKAPCNREQVFNSKHLKIIEKRLMMKFITFAMQVEENSEEYEDWDKKSDAALYQSYKLTDSLIHLIRSSLVVSGKPQLSAHEVIKSVKFYLKNVGIYCSLPYILPIYGAGELPQAFARFSAVFGSIYVLDMMVSELHHGDDGNFSGVTLSNGQLMTGKYCVMSPNYSHPDYPLQNDSLDISHVVILSDKSIKPKDKADENDDISTVHILKGCLDNPHFVSGYEFGPKSYCPAEGMYMLHLTTVSQTNDPKEDLGHVVNKIIPKDDYNCLYKLYFSTTMASEDFSVEYHEPKNNVVRTSFPTYNSAYAEAIYEAMTLFAKMYPEEEFLPAAPNPEDIKWPDDDLDSTENTNQATTDKVTEIKDECSHKNVDNFNIQENETSITNTHSNDVL